MPAFTARGSRCTAGAALWWPCLLAVCSGSAQAHGIALSQQTRSDLPVVEITASYDTGEPMAGAHVTVFSAAYPTHAWLTGRADRNGRFRFVPDAAQPGYWTVQIRQEGHGGTIAVEVPAPAGPSGD